jgi:mono/diheme cytochrome c family protein
MRGFWFGAVATVVAMSVFALGFAGLGFVPVSADAKPGAIEEWLADFAREAAIERAAPAGGSPVAPTPESLVAGATLYRDNCSGCHGSPDTKDNVFASSLYPPAPQFLGASGPQTVHDADGELFVVIRDGIRLTGMPTFAHMLKEDETWKLVTFLKHLDSLPPAALAALASPSSGG